MEKNNIYDVVVIGAGSGGLTSAVGFSKVGKKVLLIEKEHMGGECTNSGCIPSKALLHHAKSYHIAQQISGVSNQSETYRKNAFAYVQKLVEEILEDEQPEAFKNMGIDVVMGEAEFTGKCCLEVNKTTYHFKKAVISTGSSPRMIEIEGLNTEDTLTNQNVFDLDSIPEKLLIIGSGPIGMELGQAFSMLGSAVTLASIDDRLAIHDDPAFSPIIEKNFNDLGINFLKNAHIKNVNGKTATFTIKKEGAGETSTEISFDKVLIAIGRAPNLPQGLEKAGIKYDAHHIFTNKNYRTQNKDIFAIGDVSQRLKFTHTADNAGRQVVVQVLTKGLITGDKKKAVPKVTYTSPEIAAVGLSWDEALKKYGEKEAMRIEVPFNLNDRAKTDDITDEGLMIVITKRLTGTVLGAHIIGTHAGELLSLFTLAIDQKISMWKLNKLIYPYPSLSLLTKKASDFFIAESLGRIKTDLFYIFKKHTPKILGLIFWATLLYNFSEFRSANDLSYEDMFRMLFNFFANTMWGPFAYMIVYAIRPLIFFPATLLTALSGALFGLWWGIFYTIIGENMSANLAYWLGRFFGKDLHLEDSFIGSWVQKLRKNAFMTVLFMRLFYVPFDLTNYSSGILRVRWISYFLATLIGILPGLTTFVALGAGIKDISNFTLSYDAFDFKNIALSLIIFILSIILAKSLRKWKPQD